MGKRRAPRKPDRTTCRSQRLFGLNARAATLAEAAQSGDVVVTIPLKEHRAVPVEPLAGKIVIEANNY